MWLLYDLAILLFLALGGPILLLRRGRHYLPTLRGRLGGPAQRPRRRPGGHHGQGTPRQGALWIHAVSVGEVAVAATVVRALPEDVPVLVTTVTPTGQERARTALGKRASVAYLPFDVGFAVERFLRRHEPAALVLVEGDYWPRLLAAVRRRDLPVAVINGRVGDRSFRRMRRLRRVLTPLLAPLFRPVSRFGVQSTADRERLVALGIDGERVRVTGNLKYDSPEPERNEALEDDLRRVAAGRPLLVAGSTMAGEEEAVLDAFRPLSERALLVLAPRHPERWPEVAERVEAAGLPLRRRSRLGLADVPATGAEAPAVVLLDSLGELAGLYAVATSAFIGGTLVPTGGHNPLEAARFGVPVAVGPSMENFRDMAATFDHRGAWGRVNDASHLGRLWARWLDDPEAAREVGERGRALVEDNRGALGETLELLAPLVDSVQETS